MSSIVTRRPELRQPNPKNIIRIFFHNIQLYFPRLLCLKTVSMTAGMMSPKIEKNMEPTILIICSNIGSIAPTQP